MNPLTSALVSRAFLAIAVLTPPRELVATSQRCSTFDASSPIRCNSWLLQGGSTSAGPAHRRHWPPPVCDLDTATRATSQTEPRAGAQRGGAHSRRRGRAMSVPHTPGSWVISSPPADRTRSDTPQSHRLGRATGHLRRALPRIAGTVCRNRSKPSLLGPRATQWVVVSGRFRR
jgi:hypothetical protein